MFSIKTIGVALLAVFASIARGDTVRFAVIGDYGTTTEAADRVSALVKNWQPEFIVSVGDNNYGNNGLEHSDWDALIGRRYGEFILRRSDGKYPNQTSTTQRFFPTVGNHDAQWTGPYQSTRAGYLDYFHVDPHKPEGRLPSGIHTEVLSNYSFRSGPIEFFVFDGHAALLSDESAIDQAIWLAESASASTAPWRFAVNHYPPYSSGYEGNVASVQWPYEQWGIDAHFSGHDHIYDHLILANTSFFVVGTSGQGLYDLKPQPHPLSIAHRDDVHGALFVTVDEVSAMFEFVSEDDTVIDSYRIRKVVPEPFASEILMWLSLLAFHYNVSLQQRRKTIIRC